MTNPRLLIAVLLCVGLTGTACSDDPAANAPAPTTTTSAEDATPTAGEPAPTTTGSAAPRSTSAAEPGVSTALPKGAPTGFPVPPGAQLASVDGIDGSFAVQGQDAGAVLAFYRTALPSAGFRITGGGDLSEDGVGLSSIEFDGNGVTGTVTTMSGGIDLAVVTIMR